MSIASEINRIKTNILNAYDKCESKGATIPTDKNSANLATTIDSITGGSAPSIAIKSPYADDNGKFVKPSEWDDIESIPLSENDQVLYLLYDNTLDFSWCSITVTCNTGSSICDYGRVVNGQFQVLATETKASKSSYQKVLSDEFHNEDYIVLRIRPASTNNLTTFAKPNWTYNSRSLNGSYQPILMRYGSLPKATSVPIATYGLIVDNIQNLQAITTLADWCSNCKTLVKHRHEGWNTSNVTTASGMFYSCNILTDVSSFENLFVGTKLTNINNMFAFCYAIQEINVSGWNTERITAINQVFIDCYNLRKIVGIESWYFPNLRVTGSNRDTFNGCYALQQNEERKLDLSNWRAGENITTTTAVGGMFNNCNSLKKIDISGWNLTNNTTFGGMCVRCYSLEDVILPSSGGAGGLTTIENILQYCFSMQSIDLSMVDFSGQTNAGAPFTGCYLLKNLKSPKNIKRNMPLSDNQQLTKESLLDILNNLATVTSSTTLTLGTVNLSKLTADEIAIATNKGWSLA